MKIALINFFIIYCVIFLMWMGFRWSTKTFFDSMVKVSLALVAALGVLILIKLNHII